MVRLFTAAQMRKADSVAVGAGVPSLVLMENAGRAVARLAAEMTASFAAAPVSIVVLAGRGNNGGDGLVAARHLAERGFPVEVVLAESAGAFSGDALVNFEAMLGDGSVRPVVFGEPGAGPADVASRLERTTLIVDSLLGTGARGAPRQPAATLISLVNSAAHGGGRPPRPLVLAVDLPSGLDADTGLTAGEAVRADATVTFGGVKLGLAAPEARAFTGRLYLAPIGIPAAALEEATAGERGEPEGTAAATPTCLRWLLPAEAATCLGHRPVSGHKGTFGHVRVVAGSPGFTGAAVLAALGALRAGAGLTTVACPRGSREVVAASLPEALTQALPEDADGRLNRSAAADLLAGLDGPGGADPGRSPKDHSRTSVVVGPGLGAGPGVAAVVRELLENAPVPLLLDADALNSLAQDGPEAVTQVLAAAAAHRSSGAGPPVLTPHPGEMARLTGRPVAEIQGDRTGVAVRSARSWGAVVVLKGAGTVIAAPDGSAWINATGNSGLATAGSGDVLAGAIGAYLAQGVPPLQAALAGVSVHGLAGDLAARDIGPRGLLASDVAHRLPRAAELLPAAEGYGPIVVEA